MVIHSKPFATSSLQIKLLQPGSSLSDRAVFKHQKTGQSVELPFHYDAGGTPILGYALLSAIVALVGALVVAIVRMLWSSFVRRRPPAEAPPARPDQTLRTPPPPPPAPALNTAQNGDGPRMRTPPDMTQYFEETIERTPGYRASPLQYTPNDSY